MGKQLKEGEPRVRGGGKKWKVGGQAGRDRQEYSQSLGKTDWALKGERQSQAKRQRSGGQQEERHEMQLSFRVLAGQHLSCPKLWRSWRPAVDRHMLKNPVYLYVNQSMYFLPLSKDQLLQLSGI